MNSTTDMINTQHKSMSDKMNTHYFQVNRMNKEF